MPSFWRIWVACMARSGGEIYPRTAPFAGKLPLAARQHQGLQDLGRGAVLHESDHSRLALHGARQEGQPMGTGELSGRVEIEGAGPLQDHVVVGELLAPVLPGLDLGNELVLI